MVGWSVGSALPLPEKCQLPCGIDRVYPELDSGSTLSEAPEKGEAAAARSLAEPRRLQGPKIQARPQLWVP
jgi:hypothetical protein